MNKVVYDTVSSRWKGKVWQIWSPGRWKFTHACLREFRGCRCVVDVGCNAGVATYNIAKFAKSYLGVERRKMFYKQALVTQRYISTPGEFLRCRFKRFLLNAHKYRFDAMYASSVMYHLIPLEVALWRRRMLPKCKVVVLVSKEHKETRRNLSDLHSWKGCVRILEKEGFRVWVYNKDKQFVSVLGRKK